MKEVVFCVGFYFLCMEAVRGALLKFPECLKLNLGLLCNIYWPFFSIIKIAVELSPTLGAVYLISEGAM